MSNITPLRLIDALKRAPVPRDYAGHSLYHKLQEISSPYPEGSVVENLVLFHVVQPETRMVCFGANNSKADYHSLPLPYQLLLHKINKNQNTGRLRHVNSFLAFSHRNPLAAIWYGSQTTDSELDEYIRENLFTPYAPNVSYDGGFCLGDKPSKEFDTWLAKFGENVTFENTDQFYQIVVKFYDIFYGSLFNKDYPPFDYTGLKRDITLQHYLGSHTPGSNVTRKRFLQSRQISEFQEISSDLINASPYYLNSFRTQIKNSIKY